MGGGGSILRPTETRSADGKRRYEGTRAARVIARWKNNASDQIGNLAVFIRVQTRPVEPVATYDDWLRANIGKRAHTSLTGSKMRRIVQMIRSGSSQADAARATNMDARAVGRWLARLPPELRP